MKKKVVSADMGSVEELPSIVRKLNGDTRWRAALERGGYDDEDILEALHIAHPRRNYEGP